MQKDGIALAVKASSLTSKPATKLYIIDSILITSDHTGYAIMNYGMDQMESSNRAIIRHTNGTRGGHRRHKSHNSHTSSRTSYNTVSSPQSVRNRHQPVGEELSMNAFIQPELPPQNRQQQMSAYQTQRRLPKTVTAVNDYPQVVARPKLSLDESRRRQPPQDYQEQEHSFFDWDSEKDVDSSALRKIKSTFKVGQKRQHKTAASNRHLKDENATPKASNTVIRPNFPKTRLQPLQEQKQYEPPASRTLDTPVVTVHRPVPRPIPTERKSYDTSRPTARPIATPSKPRRRGRSPPPVPPPLTKEQRNAPPIYPHMLHPKLAPAPRLSSDNAKAMQSTYNNIALMQKRQQNSQESQRSANSRYSPRLLRPSYEEDLPEGYPGNEARRWDECDGGNPPPTPTSLNSNATGSSKNPVKRARLFMHEVFAKVSISDLKSKAKNGR